ncbi:MAG: hypothetical protein JJE35_01970 [Thermoleophilia bacterium]|nr:hypothetical protein [Thermoleophilia bacterium]
MERTMWTDERLDERFNGIDRRFDHVDGDLREVRTDLRELRSLLVQLWGSTILGLIGVIVTVLITNG